jgi:hypothetical protein
MKQRKFEGASTKKSLQKEAEQRFGSALTKRTFDSAYKAVFDRKRGRPIKALTAQQN